jgi:transcriptional regulator with XRE-family HTH domain
MEYMSNKDEAREFLISRRAHVTTADAGLPDFGGDRRVPGLRREEVAMLAGVSLDYYNRLERGNIRGASESVLNAVARALQLDDAEREHLFHLAHGAPLPTAAPPRTTDATVRSSVQRVLDNMNVPAVVTNAQQDMISANDLGRALHSPHFDVSGRPNMARFIFLDSRAPAFYTDWPLARRMNAAMLRLEAGRNPLNEQLTALIGELSTRSPHFREEWAQHDVHEHRTGRKTFNHPEVGPILLTFDAFDLPGEPDLSIVTYSTEPGTTDADRLALLASWVASRQS